MELIEFLGKMNDMENMINNFLGEIDKKGYSDLHVFLSIIGTLVDSYCVELGVDRKMVWNNLYDAATSIDDEV